MTFRFANIFFLVLAAGAALCLASCGRRGPLEPPPGAAVSSFPLTGRLGDSEAPAAPGGLPGAGAPAAPPGPATPAAARVPAKPFFLDPLL